MFSYWRNRRKLRGRQGGHATQKDLSTLYNSRTGYPDSQGGIRTSQSCVSNRKGHISWLDDEKNKGAEKGKGSSSPAWAQRNQEQNQKFPKRGPLTSRPKSHALKKEIIDKAERNKLPPLFE